MSSKIKTLYNEMDFNCISIHKFLVLYCGISGDKLKDKKISHEELKILLPHIKRTSFDQILNNKKLMYTGDIITVKDSFGQIIPYEKPIIEDKEMDFNYELDSKDKEIENIIIDEDLNKYELVNLCRYFKYLGRMKEYRVTHRLLKKLKDPNVKKYKIKKKELVMKGRKEND